MKLPITILLLAGVLLVFLNLPSTIRQTEQKDLGLLTVETPELTIINAFTTNTVSGPQDVKGFRHVGFSFVADSATGTLKFACSTQNDEPNFGASASVTNRWDYVDVTDLEDGASIDGDTGVSLTGTTDVRRFEVNSDHSTFCGAEVTSFTTGTISVYLDRATNE